MEYPKDQEKWMAQWALKNEWITEEQHQECLKIQEQLREQKHRSVSIIDILVEKEYLSKNQKVEILKEWEKKTGEKKSIICEHCGAQFPIELQKMGKNLKCGQCGMPLPTSSGSGQQEPLSAMGRVRKTLGFLAMSRKEKINVPGYKILERIGEDTTGTTYKGLTKDKKKVIIKVLNDETLADKAFVNEMEQTVKHSLKTDIPNARKNYEFINQENQVYIVSEYIEGESLHTILQRKNKISVEKSLKIVLRIAKILWDAKEEGLIHGDINPSNVIINETGKVIIANLGIPTKVDKNVFDIATKDGIAPLYLAPELLSKEQKPDHRTDMYALGAIFYHLLAGKPPIEGNSPFAVLNRITENAPIPPLQIYNPEVPHEISQIIEKMMAPEMEQRYQDYGTLISHLQNPESIHSSQKTEQEKESEESEESKEEQAKETPQEKSGQKSSAAKKAKPQKTVSSKPQTMVEGGTEESLKQLASDSLRPQRRETIPWGKVIFGSIILGLAVWGISSWIIQNNTLKEADADYEGLKRHYKKYHQDPDKWADIDKKLRSFLSKYKDVQFPTFGNDRTIAKEVESMLDKLKGFRDKHVNIELDTLFKKADAMCYKGFFCAAIEALDQIPEYLFTEKGSVKIKNFRNDTLKKARQRLESAEKSYNQAMQSQKYQKALTEIEPLVENFGKDAKSLGEFSASIEQLKKYLSELKTADAEQQKQKETVKKEKTQAMWNTMQKQLDAYLATYDYRTASRFVSDWYKNLPKDIQIEIEIQAKNIQQKVNTLAKGKEVLISLLNSSASAHNLKIMHEKKQKNVTKVSENDLLLAGNVTLSWKNIAKEDLFGLIETVENKVTDSQVSLQLSLFSMELENYVLAYRILGKIVEEKKEAKEYMTKLETILTQQIEETFKNMDEAVKHSRENEAFENALLIKEKYLLPGVLAEKYDANLNKYFLEIFKKVYGTGVTKSQYHSFSHSDNLKDYETASAKFSIEEGKLQFFRGQFAIPQKDVVCIVGLCRFDSKDQKLTLNFLKDVRTVYSMSIGGDGKVSYGAFHAKGGVKNEKLAEMANHWFCFAMFISESQIYYHINLQNHFSAVYVPEMVQSKIQFQVLGTKATPVLLDEIYIGMESGK